MDNSLKALLIAILASGVCFSPKVLAAEQADIIFMNGQIETLNTKQPKANAVAIKDEKFIAIGSDQKIKGYIGANTQVINLKQILPAHVVNTCFYKTTC